MNSTSGFSNVMHQDRNPTMQPDATKWFSQWQKEKKRKDYTFRVNLMRSQVLYRAAQGHKLKFVISTGSTAPTLLAVCAAKMINRVHWPRAL